MCIIMHDNIFRKPMQSSKKVCLPSVCLDGWYYVIWYKWILKTLVKGLTEKIWINIWTCIFSKYFVSVTTTLPVIFSGDKLRCVE